MKQCIQFCSKVELFMNCKNWALLVMRVAFMNLYHMYTLPAWMLATNPLWKIFNNFCTDTMLVYTQLNVFYMLILMMVIKIWIWIFLKIQGTVHKHLLGGSDSKKSKKKKNHQIFLGPPFPTSKFSGPPFRH